MSRNARRAEPHVRLYKHELECAAYRSLSTEARALLVEMRALYRGRDNQVFMSRRQIQTRLGVGRLKAEKARDELIDRGFIRLLEPASFQRKVRHAPMYALTNEPDNPDRDGAVPRKDFMRWIPPQEKNSTGPVTDRAGADDQPRSTSEKPGNARHGVGEQPRKRVLDSGRGAGDQPTDKLPSSNSVQEPSHLMDAAFEVDDDDLQLALCRAVLLLSFSRGEYL